MTTAFVDADVIVRLISGDDPAKQSAAAALFQHVERGTLQVTTPPTTLADCLYVLCSPRLYKFSRAEAVARLLTLVKLPHFRLGERRTLIRALELYASTNIDFGDALIAASMFDSGASVVYSYDEHFDRLPGIIRQAPPL
jgi:predicted nucleic acid-binding protein